MKVTPLEIPGVLLIEPDLFHDSRGLFCETFHARRYTEAEIRKVLGENFLRAFSKAEQVANIKSRQISGQGSLKRINK